MYDAACFSPPLVATAFTHFACTDTGALDSVTAVCRAAWVMEQIGTLGYFGDTRRAAVGTELIDRVVATGSLVIRKLGVDRAGEMAIHRFLSAPSVSCAEMLQTLGSRSVAACAGRRIVVAQDTTEINFSGREANRHGLGPGGDGIADGFFIHPLIAIDSETEAVLGLVDAQIWTRDEATRAAPRRGRMLEGKESARWLRGAERAAELITDAASVVVVSDRESDIYGCFVRRPATADLIIRAAHDRALVDAGRLFSSTADWPELAQLPVKVAPRRVGDPGRTATVALRAGPVLIKRPRIGFEVADPETVALTLIEAREISAAPDGKPLLWRLLTTIAVDDAEAACDVVRLYRLRWRIEEVFRAQERWHASRRDTTACSRTPVQAGGRCTGCGIPNYPTGRCPRRQYPPGDRRDRPGLAADRPGHRPDPGTQDRAPEKPPPHQLPRMAGLDHREARRLELLLQTTRTKNHASRLGTVRHNGRGIRNRHRRNREPTVKCVNPVAPLREGPGEG